jgi:hypothetical protein
MQVPRYIDSLKNPKIPGFKWQDPEDDSDRKMFRDILEYGCQVLAIQAGQNTPEFCYSVGLYLNFLHPEILIMGLSQQSCHKAINQICHEASEGKIIAAGDIRTELFESGRPVRFITVRKDLYLDYIPYAHWFYRSLFFQPPAIEQKFPVLQALWPGKEMRYPDDPTCHPSVRKAQTLVKLPPKST